MSARKDPRSHKAERPKVFEDDPEYVPPKDRKPLRRSQGYVRRRYDDRKPALPESYE